MKQWRRKLAALLASVMLLAMLPVMAYAVEVVDSGECGDQDLLCVGKGHRLGGRFGVLAPASHIFHQHNCHLVAGNGILAGKDAVKVQYFPRRWERPNGPGGGHHKSTVCCAGAQTLQCGEVILRKSRN